MSFTTKTLSEQLEKTAEYLKNEYKSLSTGRASLSVLDHIYIMQYGSKMQVAHVAGVTLEDARTLRVAPWDKTVIHDLEKAINEADLGLSVSSDGEGLRVHFPMLTGETRQKLVKVLKEKLEESRVRVRGAREEANKEIESLAKEGQFGEDEKKRFKDDVQKKVDEANSTLEELFAGKEKEVLGE
jgi:ribosome recycling factor